MRRAYREQRQWTIAFVCTLAAGGSVAFAGEVGPAGKADARPAWFDGLSPEVFSKGEELFAHEWKTNDPLAKGDGLGPVFNDTSCAACHSQAGAGGAGDATHNVTTFEVIPTRLDPAFHKGQVHAKSLDGASKETTKTLRELFPEVHNAVTIVSSAKERKTDTLNPVRVANVNSTALFGEGLIDLIPESAIWSPEPSYAPKSAGVKPHRRFPEIPVGRPSVLPDGRIGRFGWKGQAATLREFVAGACAGELGLGTSISNQPTPLPFAKAALSSVKPPADLDDAQLDSLVSFVAALPRPQRIVPGDVPERNLAHRGEMIFDNIGCGECHTPDLGGVQGIYSDLLLHSLLDVRVSNLNATLEGVAQPGFTVIGDERFPLRNDLPDVGASGLAPIYYEPAPAEVKVLPSDLVAKNNRTPLRQLPPTKARNALESPVILQTSLPTAHPKPSEWRTPPLWGVASSAPYLHDGSAATIEEAILLHSGDASSVTFRYRQLGFDGRNALLAFLNTLAAPDSSMQAVASKDPTAQFRRAPLASNAR